MKFEQTRIELVPRSAANCLDLALMLCGRNLGTLIGLWALFAVPLGTITYFAARWTDWGFLTALACGWFGTAPLGVMLIGGVARMAFGEEFSLRKMLADLRIDWPMALRVLLLRVPLALATWFCVLPGTFLGLRWSFLAENRVLSKLHEQRHDRRMKELINLEFTDLYLRGAAVVCAGCVFWLIAELTVDVVWTILFNRSLFFGRFGEIGEFINHQSLDFGEQYFERFLKLAFSDPAVLTLHLATGLAAYAVCRLAWFLCYIDLRVRRDCWDLELELLDEAQRLQTSV
jgi:hypothetical protein